MLSLEACKHAREAAGTTAGGCAVRQRHHTVEDKPAVRNRERHRKGEGGAGDDVHDAGDEGELHCCDGGEVD